jgi:hypothetical protein
MCYALIVLDDDRLFAAGSHSQGAWLGRYLLKLVFAELRPIWKDGEVFLLSNNFPRCIGNGDFA